MKFKDLPKSLQAKIKKHNPLYAKHEYVDQVLVCLDDDLFALKALKDEVGNAFDEFNNPEGGE